MRVLILVLLLAQPAAACGVCGFEMLNCALPFYSDWMKVLTVWLGLALLIRLVTFSLSRSECRSAAAWAAVFVVGAAFVAPLVALALMLWWLIAFLKLWWALRGREAGPGERPLLGLNQITAAVLVVVAVFAVAEKRSMPELEYKMSRLRGSAAGYGLRSRIARERLLTPPDLIRLARQGSELQRYNAVSVMGRYGEPAFVPVLIEKLEDEDASVSSAALDSLREITGERLTLPAEWRRWMEESSS